MKLKSITLDSFTKNVVTLISGTVLSQLISMAVSPILTRIYTPSEFGVFSLYLSVISILGIVSTGRYELAIMLPEKDEDSYIVFLLSIIMSFFVSLVSLIIILLFRNDISHILGSFQEANWLYLIPVSTFLIGLFNSLNYWCNRKEKFKQLAISKVGQSLTNSTFSLSFGLLKFGYFGLILGNIISQGIVSGILVFYNRGEKLVGDKKIKKNEIYRLAKRYSNFPKFLIFAHAINTASSQLPIILLAPFFGSDVAGYFALAQRTVRLPMSIVASSYGDVFRQKASNDYINYGNCREVYIKTLKNLLLISLIPFLFLYFLAPKLFVIIFGIQWLDSGNYIQIMSLMFLLQFICTPLSSMFAIAEKQKLDLLWQVLLLSLTLLSLCVGYYVLDNINDSIRLFSYSYCLMYIVNLLMSYNFSKGKRVKFFNAKSINKE